MTTIPLVAVVGNPNAGKSALFNMLTGARQKVGNYPGVTVERKSGRLSLADGRPVELVDLPGAYSLDPSSPDEEVTRDVVIGRQQGERLPDALLIVLDATNLDNHLRFALQLIGLGLPTVVALNMVDLATRDGLTINIARLSEELGVPVIETVAVRRRGIDSLKEALSLAVTAERRARAPDEDFTAVQRRARAIARASVLGESAGNRTTGLIDRIALHPVAGPIIFALIMFFIFQAVFAWSEAPVGWLEGAVAALQGAAVDAMPDTFLRSMIVDGVLGGVGAVVVFLPQILILFLFILLLEATGYMVRAAFLMDRLMARVGLSGHAFIPLLSSFACAVPGIMATRTIEDPKHRLTTILIAPLMTCSARLPVYAVIIGAFIPAADVGSGIGLQGLVLFGLYLAGIVGALSAAAILRRTVAKGSHQSFMMEMPKYQLPSARDVAIGLWQRAAIFLKRAGTIILVSTIILWALLSFPQPKEGETTLDSSIAGKLASGLETVVRPIGFNHEIALALIPAMAAREVAVSALATAYSIESDDEAQTEQSLIERLRGRWSLPTALAFLAWFVFAPQCLSTIAVTRRETNGWKWPAFMLAYLFGLAYLAAGTTYWLAIAAGL
ncbi:ferrous iron transporter B [Allosphingosinicella flava]|uniref:Fe(2+) transporter FeoB n=1 Tax=Allosphingosinicella flava TaxID=2771430 RepID=A0A7T2GIU7_9SPHN|nr:ferrous iron transporter B [Sphingosinicella flava]QPQ54673.1 ferrous iron transporter B [Sphingosinicella flava]